MSGWRAGALIDEEYRLVGRIGAGGMGEVWRAERRSSPGSECCLKSLTIPSDGELLARFEREGQAQARVDAHPNVTRVHALGLAEGRPYLVVDLADGGDLRDRLRHGPLSPEEAAELVRDLAHGLAHVHARGVLHRDLKPANVLFARGVPQLTDFGIAKVAGAESLTATGALLGTPAYMAPEQLQGRGDERTDVYGLGAILYHCLTGQPPFSGGSSLAVITQVANEAPPRPERVRPGLPAGLSAICMQALEKDLARRFGSAEALGAALSEWLAEPDDARRSLPWIAAASVALLLGVGLWASDSSDRGSATAGASAPLPEPTAKELVSEPAPVRAARVDPFALDAADEKEVADVLACAEGFKLSQGDPRAMYLWRRAKGFRHGGRERVAVALYRRILAEGCPPAQLRRVIPPLAMLLYRAPSVDAETRRYVIEGAVRDQGWALKAIASTHLGDVHWRRILPEVTLEIAAAAAKAYQGDGQGPIEQLDATLTLGHARRRLVGFLLRQIGTSGEVSRYLASVTEDLTGGSVEAATPNQLFGQRVTLTAKNLLNRHTPPRVTLEVLCLTRLAAANVNGSALLRLAHWYLGGVGVRRSPEFARRLVLSGAAWNEPRCLWDFAHAVWPEIGTNQWTRKLGLRPNRALAAQALAIARRYADPGLRAMIDAAAARGGLTLPKEAPARLDLSPLFVHHKTSSWL